MSGNMHSSKPISPVLSSKIKLTDAAGALKLWVTYFLIDDRYRYEASDLLAAVKTRKLLQRNRRRPGRSSPNLRPYEGANHNTDFTVHFGVVQPASGLRSSVNRLRECVVQHPKIETSNNRTLRTDYFYELHSAPYHSMENDLPLKKYSRDRTFENWNSTAKS